MRPGSGDFLVERRTTPDDTQHVSSEWRANCPDPGRQLTDRGRDRTHAAAHAAARGLPALDLHPIWTSYWRNW